MFYYSFLIFLITFILMVLGLILSKKSSKSKEKNSPYECGFDNISSSRSSFSIQFFIITIVFIIFDVELSIILPFSVIKMWISMSSFNLLISFTFLILFLGLIYEWLHGALNWMK